MENISTTPKTKLFARKRNVPFWMDRFALSGMTTAMMCSDLLGLTLAGVTAILLRRVLLGKFVPDLFVWFVPVAVLMVVKFASQHLYPGTGLGVVEEFRRLATSISLIFIVVSTLSLVLREGEYISRFVYLLFWMFSIVMIPAFRLVVRHVLSRMELWGEPVVIIGAREPARRLCDHFDKDPKIGLRPVVIFTAEEDGGDEAFKTPVHPIEHLGVFQKHNQVKIAAVVYDDLNEVEEICNRYRDTFKRVALFDARGNHFFFNQMQVQQYGGLISLEVRHSLLDPSAQAVKRAMDVVISGVALVLLVPFFVLLAGLIRMDSPGPILYRQARVGKKGKRYTMFKFRTMHVNAEEVLQSCLEKDEDLKAEWEQFQKLKDDPRITRVGRFLRRFSIDELVQLWNVLKGEMSLVGPRPIMLNQERQYGENYEHYIRVAPGISGLWQISGRNRTSFSRRAELDMEYVMSWSVWLDIYIMIRTVWVVLRREGAS